MIVKLYGAEWCPSCKQAKEFLESQNVDFQYVDVESEIGRTEFITKTRSRSIPVLVVNDTDNAQIVGFNVERYEQLLKL